MNNLTLLFDADMLVYKVTSAAETKVDWGDCISGEPNVKGAITHFKRLVDRLRVQVFKKLKYKGAAEEIMCFTDSTNFRKTLLPSYKAHRAGKEKPLGYLAVKAWVEQSYTTYQRKGLEGDDCIGILATTLKEPTVIISGDKDFKTVPGLYYDYLHDKMYRLSEEDADYWHLYQTLIGDTTDGYKGCPGIGDVKAKAILDSEAAWEAVVRTYEAKGLTEEDALLQARVARILRKEDYDFKNKKPKLWKPRA